MRIKKLIGYDADDLLDVIGLARRRTIVRSLLPAFGLVAFGAAVGMGIGLMVAPSSGRRLRQDVGDRLEQMRDRIKSEAQKKGGIVSEANAPH